MVIADHPFQAHHGDARAGRGARGHPSSTRGYNSGARGRFSGARGHFSGARGHFSGARGHHYAGAPETVPYFHQIEIDTNELKTRTVREGTGLAELEVVIVALFLSKIGPD
jgi:hypothetical protein